MRLGILGGTFDPIHWGHLLLAERCREACCLDEFWFLPAGSPPHKQQTGITSGKTRTEMVELATAGCPEFSVNTMEFDREGPSYTYQTLQILIDEDPRRELFFLIGADMLRDFPTWREPEKVLELATVVAVNRGGSPPPEIDPVVEQCGEWARSRVMIVEMPAIDLSSSEIRARVARGQSIRFMTPRSVEQYIHEHGLYRD